MAITLTAVFDACVLYPAPIRDLLVELAYRRVIEARWTAEIHEEWTRNLRANRPDIDPGRLERTKAMMDRVRGCLVAGHMDLIPSLTLPDPDDRHVLAAAIHSGATIIVTKNLKDFPPSVLDNHHIKALHPDPFLLGLLDDGEEAFCLAVEAVRERLRNPPKTVEDYLLTLEQQELSQTSERLREFVDRI